MTEEEKIIQILDAQEHPEHYSDNDIDDILEDTKDITDLKRAITDEYVHKEDVNVDEAWERFENDYAYQGKGKSLLKIAASVIGIIFVCTIAYAASIRLGIINNPLHKDVVVETKDTDVERSSATKSTLEKNGTATRVQQSNYENSPKVIEFDNEELDKILPQIALYYNVKVVYGDEAVRHIRLHFNWNQSQSVDDVVALLNSFQQINIVRDGNVLIVNY